MRNLSWTPGSQYSMIKNSVKVNGKGGKPLTWINWSSDLNND